MAAKTDRPTYTLALAASQAVASWPDLPIHREYVQEQKNRLVATAAEGNLCQYADHVNTAAVAVIRWLQAKHDVSRKKALGLDVDEAIALLDDSRRTDATDLDRLNKKVTQFEKQVNRPKSPRDKRREQRLKFIKPRIAKGLTWSIITDKYRQKYPKDETAIADSLRRAWSRRPEEYR